VNLFYLLTFPATALAAYAVLRRLSVSGPVASVCATIYTLLPYHFGHGQAHVFLADYLAVPLALLLAMRAYGGEPLFRLDDTQRGVRRLFTRRTLATVTIAVVLGGLGTYYAIVGAMLIATGAVVSLLTGRGWRAALSPLVVAAIIAGSLGLNGLPDALYRSSHGTNPLVGQRLTFESELYALKLSYLVLPVPGHRIGPLARLTARYEASTQPPTNEAALATLGVVGDVGLLVLMLVALAALSGRPLTTPRRRVAGRAAALTAVTFLLATVGGGSALIAELISPQLRAWGRTSVFIAFLCLLAVGLLLDATGERLRARRRGGPFVLGAGLAAVLAIGVLDETSNRFVPGYRLNQTSYRADDQFVKTIEAKLPRGAEVLQLPYVPFPESVAVGGVNSYDEQQLWLHSGRLRWSSGAMRERPQDWLAARRNLPVIGQVSDAALAGFDGLVIDTRGYPANAPQVVAQIQSLTRVAPVASRTLLFFDLRPLAARLDAGRTAARSASRAARVLHPVAVVDSSGFGTALATATGSERWMGPDGALTLRNPLPVRRTVQLNAGLAAGAPSPSTLTLSAPGAAPQTFTAGPSGTLKATLVLRPGDTTIRLRTTAPPSGHFEPGIDDPRLLISDLIITDPFVT
jgi:phosphoglycerol transferase